MHKFTLLPTEEIVFRNDREDGNLIEVIVEEIETPDGEYVIRAEMTPIIRYKGIPVSAWFADKEIN